MMQKGAERKSVVIAGTGSYLPQRILANTDLEKMVDTTHEWIHTRTGITERHIAAEGEATSDMAAKAAKAALEAAGVPAAEVDAIIVATITPDMGFPNTACFVQQLLGAKKAFCFDIEAACSGFLYAVEIARQFITGGTARTVLVIGAEKLSCITDWEDRATCVLFGDGAGAVVLRKGDGAGIMSCTMGSDGALADLLKLPGGGSRHPASKKTVEDRLHYMKMEGREVFKYAVRCMCEAGKTALEQCQTTIDEVRYVIPHQANMRIIQAIADKFKVSLDRFYVNLGRVGNISAASIPVALDELVRAGGLKKGDKLLFVAFGGGFTWAATVVEWEK